MRFDRDFGSRRIAYSERVQDIDVPFRQLSERPHDQGQGDEGRAGQAGSLPHLQEHSVARSLDNRSMKIVVGLDVIRTVA